MTSRYAKTDRTWVPHPSRGWVQVTFRSPNVWDNQAYVDYIATEVDDMVRLSTLNYDDPNRYWGIAEMNPEVGCPDDLSAGTVLQLPARPR